MCPVSRALRAVDRGARLSWRWGSNPPPPPYPGGALATELPPRLRHTGTAMIEAVRRLRPATAIVTALVLVASPACGDRPEATLEIDTGQDQVEVEVEVADTLRERTVGLMNREELDEDAGMVFLV